MQNELTLQDLFSAIQQNGGQIEKLSVGVKEGFAYVNQRVDEVLEILEFHDQRFEKIESKIDKLESQMSSVRSQMVTKSYLDDKLADLRADLVLLARKGNRKFEVLVEELVVRGSLKPDMARRILMLEPFPQT